MHLFSIAILLSLALNAQGAVEQRQATIKGANVFTLVDPTIWNKKLIVIAHGYVSEDRPLAGAVAKGQQHLDH